MEEEEVDEFGIPIKVDEFGIPKRKVDEYGIPAKASVLETIAAGVGGFNRGISQVVIAPLKAIGAVEEFVGGVGLASQAGQAIEEFVERINPRYENVNQTYQSVTEGLGQAVGMIASAGSSSATQVGSKAAPSVISSVVKRFTSRPAVIGGSMTAVPEWEAAKEAGLSDSEAFEVFLKNYAVGQTEQIPIQNLISRINKITGGRVLETVKAMGVQGIEEGLQEGVQTYLTNQIAREDYDPDRDPLFQVLESAKVGGIVGLILPGAMSIANGATGERRVKLERKLGELQANEAINESDTGDPQINAEIDAPAQVDPVDKQVLEEVKVAEAVQEEQKQVEAEEKLQEDLKEGTESTEKKEKTKSAENKSKKSGETAEKEVKPSQTPEYKIAVDRVKKLQEQFAALPIDENADELLFELREARKDLQKIAGKPKPSGKKTDLQKQIEDTTGVTKPDKSVQLTPQQALAAQIRIQDRGIKIGRDLTQENVVSKIKAAAKEANLTPKQIASISSRAERVSLTPKSVEKFNQYVQKVVSDADYNDKVAQAQSLRKKIRKKAKNATPPEKQAFSDFLQLNPDDVNIDEYNSVAEEITQSFRPVTSEGYKPLKLRTISDFTSKQINSQFAKDFPGNTETLSTRDKLNLINDKRAEERREAQNERLRAKLEKNFTPEEVNSFMEILSNETEVDKELNDLNKKEQVRQVFKQLAEQRQDDLPELEDITDKQREILASLKQGNLNLLTADQLKLYIQLADRITENEDFGKAGFIPVILQAEEDYKKFEKLNLNILGITDYEQEISANLPAVFRAITGLPEDAAKFQLYLGIKGLNDIATASVKASEKFVEKMNELNQKFTKLYGSERNGFTDESIFRQGIYAELIKYDALADPALMLERNKEAIEATITTYSDSDQSQDAKVYDRLFGPFRKAKTVEEVTSIMNSIDPAGKRVVDFIIEYMKPYGQRVNESNLLYYNKPTQDIVNYAKESRWYRVSEVGQEQTDSESDLQDIDALDSYKVHPSNPKQDRSQLEFKRVIPKGKVLDFNLHHSVNRQIQRVHFKTEATPYMLQVREMIRNRERMKNVLGGGPKSDAIYGKLFNANTGAYFRFENNLLNKGEVPTSFDRTARNVMNVLRKWGYNLRLGGLTQWVKQPTVLINTMIQSDPAMVTESINEIYSNPTGYQEFIKGETVSMRGEQKSLFNIGDSYVASLDKNLKNEINQALGKGLPKYVEKVFENKLTGIGALVSADRFAANPSYVAFYKKYLKDNGIKYLGFSEENKLRDTQERREARAVAKQMLDDLQVVSNPAEMIAKLQSDRDYKTQVAKAILFPFGGFSTSTKQRLFSDWRALATGNSKQRNYALKDITATFAEQAVFQTINQFALGYLWHTLGEFYEWAFDLPDDDDEEKFDKWWQRTWTGMLLDNIPLILTSPGEEVFIDAFNYTGYSLYKATTGEDITFKQYAQDVGLPLSKYHRPDDGTLTELLDYLGPIAAPLQNAISIGKTVGEAFNSDLTPEQRKFAAWVMFMQWANITGVWPSDLTSGTLREFREQIKMSKSTGGGSSTTTELPDVPTLPELPELPEL